jgi:uncharacterized protein YjbI with pentapeptide repeats
VSFTGADLVGANLTDVDASYANFTDADLSSANMGKARLAYADLTRANLTGANIRTASLVGAKLDGAKLGKVDLTGINLRGASFTGVDLTGANLTNANAEKANFTDANLTGANLTDVNAEKANFTNANLTVAKLAKTNLAGANLSQANFSGANLITATLTGAVWKETGCPHGGKSSTGCSPFQTAPDADYPGAGGTYDYGKPQWYQARSQWADTSMPNILLGTPDAPMLSRSQRWSSQTPDDGVQGNIYNDSPYRIIVRTTYAQSEEYPQGPDQEAILEPGGVMPYQIWERGTLEFFRAPEGQPEGLPTKYYLEDGFFDYPTTKFTPPGSANPVSERIWQNYNDYNFRKRTHFEIWGETRLKVTREKDGWRIPKPSDAYNNRYGWPSGEDWAIFTIRVESLAPSAPREGL